MNNMSCSNNMGNQLYMNNRPNMNNRNSQCQLPCNNMQSGNVASGNNSCKLTADKCVLMKNIYELGFILTETNLYLDTHPDDNEAIEYYARIKDKYCECMTKYSEYYGPLDKLHMSNDNYWMWVATPMPWEMEGC